MQLLRITHQVDATLGILVDDFGTPKFATLENPWRNNQRNISCIPTGLYLCKRHDSPKFGETFKVFDLQGREPAGRSQILFHVGNFADDTSGCILLGNHHFISINTGNSAINESRSAFNTFMVDLEDEDSFELLIRNV
jgi:hypothetical protein